MTEWTRVGFADAVQSRGSGGDGLPQSQWAEHGKYPVIGQGSEFIEGWTDREDLVVTPKPAVVLYGGHTRRAKFVDRPFVPGPNVKILEPEGRLDAKFLFYFLAQLSIASRGYADHFPEVRRCSVPIPPLVEQRRIADVLDRAEALRVKRRAALVQLDTLTQSIFLDMFGDPIANPKGFSVRRMIELVDPQRPISYGILMPGPDQTEGVKYVRVVDMRDGGIELSGIRKTTETISNAFRRSLLKPGDLLMSIRGHVGRFAVVPAELGGANITQDTARLAIVGADPVFVRECLRTQGFQHWMVKHTKGVAVRGINLGDVKLMPIIMPDLETQREFARLAIATGKLRASHRASIVSLDSMFASLQHRAFRGEL